jgi:Amt family ammonium transporter
VVGVHLVGGLLGSILLGFFADHAVNGIVSHEGVFLGGGGELLKDQVVAALVTLAFSFVVSFVLAKVIDKTIGLRVTVDEELEGLDRSQHAETAYALNELMSNLGTLSHPTTASEPARTH